MTDEQQLKLQAFFDGELPEKESREVASWVARDVGATALMGELRNTRKALSDFEPAFRLPETREFYWSKIEREIQRLSPAEEPVETVRPLSLLRRWLIPAGTLAGIALAVIVVGLQFGLLNQTPGPQTEMSVSESGVFTYRDFANGTTLVWLPYPAEREIAQNTTH